MADRGEKWRTNEKLKTNKKTKRSEGTRKVKLFILVVQKENGAIGN